jgi:hypothetical protein
VKTFGDSLTRDVNTKANRKMKVCVLKCSNQWFQLSWLLMETYSRFNEICRKSRGFKEE